MPWFARFRRRFKVGTILFIKVAIPRPIESLFDYEYEEEKLGPIGIGDLVEVSFGRAKVIAVVMETSSQAPQLDEKIKIKKAIQKIVSAFSITPDIFKLCQFGSEYYQYPIGEAFFVALPPKPEKKLGTRKEKPFPGEAQDKVLNEEQDLAFRTLKEQTQKKSDTVFLLEGVTGSGKTEVYIEFAKEILKSGKSVLILVPEIALTAQLKDRFEQALGYKIALWHSALADGLRQTQWLRVKEGDIKVVVGARSAVFAPFQDLGLIVVDEEHDQTYKQEERFRYQARDLAIFRSKLLKIPIILGSATPSIESIQRVREGRYQHLVMKNRYSTRPLPEIHLISLIDEPLIINHQIKTPITEKTVRMMQAAIDRGEQVMVFLNRRGFSQFILCHDCGWIKKCDHCSISMTHYQRRNELRCHVCGTKAKVPDTCESCHGHTLSGMGSGTEALEEELKLLLNNAKLLRLDRDQVTSQKRLEEVLAEFRNLEANVLIGTQMLVKGHDFPKVTCVVVMMADMLLKWPDFRASERALQTLTQVAGRAGRAELPGKVLIQGYDLEHPVLKILTGIDLKESFINEELELREALHYPPFGRFVRYRFEHSDPKILQQKAEKIAALLRTEAGELAERLMGPSEALLFRANHVYRYDVYFKAPSLDALFAISQRVKRLTHAEELNLIVDVDPYSS
jgi:primosomal protein N' (replication factor Y)